MSAQGDRPRETGSVDLARTREAWWSLCQSGRASPVTGASVAPRCGMKNIVRSFAIVATFATLSACSSRSDAITPASTIPGHGAISIAVTPNPIVARAAGGDLYDFPFELSVRETGGREVRIDRVSLDVYALGAIHVYSESYDQAKIAALGYPTSIAAGSEAHYRLSPRKSADERLFGGVSGELLVDGTDAAGNRVAARTTVTVTR